MFELFVFGRHAPLKFNRMTEIPNIVVQDIAHPSSSSRHKKGSGIGGGSEGGWQVLELPVP